MSEFMDKRRFNGETPMAVLFTSLSCIDTEKPQGDGGENGPSLVRRITFMK
jgi:hypothetical protein